MADHVSPAQLPRRKSFCAPVTAAAKLALLSTEQKNRDAAGDGGCD